MDEETYLHQHHADARRNLSTPNSLPLNVLFLIHSKGFREGANRSVPLSRGRHRRFSRSGMEIGPTMERNEGEEKSMLLCTREER